jgi:asparagine synthase (glutamine-hydrolysing)
VTRKETLQPWSPLSLVDGSAMKALDPNAYPVVVTPEPTPYRWTELESELARTPARHAPVALSGHGGDALLWFNPWYWAEWLAKGQVPRLARAFYEKERLFGTRLHPALRAGAARKWAAWTGGPTPLPAWLSPDFVARTKAAERRMERPLPASKLDVRGLVADPFWSNIFTWGDPSFTGLPICFRYPFLDLRLLRFVRGLPPDPWLRNKRILRDATLSRLPPAVRQRPKTPLVEATLPGHTDEVIDQLARMVRDAPDLDRFVNREVLVSDLIANGAATVAHSERALSHPLGLAYWLLHLSKPAVPPTRGDAAKPLTSKNYKRRQRD